MMQPNDITDITGDVKLRRFIVGLLAALAWLVTLPAAAEPRRSEWPSFLEAAALAAVSDMEAASTRLGAIEPSARSPEVLAAQGLVAYAQGRRGWAQRRLEAAVAADPTLVAGHYWLGIMALGSGRTKAATELFDRTVSLAPSDGAPRLARAVARHRAGAAGAVTDVIAASTSEPNLLMPSYYPDPRREIISLVERSLEAFPSKANLSDAVIRMLFDAGLFIEAEGRAESSKSGVAFEVRGRLALQRGELDNAVEMLRKSVRAAPSVALARFHLARALHARGETLRARASLEAASRLEPRNPHIHTALGEILLDGGNLAAARRRFSRSLELGPDPRAASGLARVEELDGNMDIALETYSVALRLDPAAARTLARLAELHERLGAPSRAAALRKRSAAIDAEGRQFAVRAERIEKALRTHGEICRTVRETPRASLHRLGSTGTGVSPAARAFAEVAAFSALSNREKAGARARVFLSGFPAKRLTEGLSPTLHSRRKIGGVVTFRLAVMEYVSLLNKQGL